jgi:GLPGLI family protein
MKRNQRYTILMLVFALATGFNGYTQKAGSPFKGFINYDITYPDAKMEASQLAMLPKTMKVSLNGNKARIDMNMPSMSQIVLINADQQTTTILIDMMGNKIAMKPNKKNESANAKEPVIVITSETKEIAGFVCKKAEINFGDEKSKGSPIIVYYTDAIGNNKLFYDNEYRTLPGIPMEFQYKMQGMNMLLTASSVEKGKVSNRDFEVPSDYKEMTPEEIRQMFGGGQ